MVRKAWGLEPEAAESDTQRESHRESGHTERRMLGPAHFLLYLQLRIPVHGMPLPAFRVELLNIS